MGKNNKFVEPFAMPQPLGKGSPAKAAGARPTPDCSNSESPVELEPHKSRPA